MIYTASISLMNKLTRNNLTLKRENIYLITRSDKVANSAIKNGWNYRNELAPSWDLFKETKALKENGEWDKEKFETFYLPKFLNGLKSLSVISVLNEIIHKVNNGEDVYLVCFCSSHEMCHRSIVASVISAKTNKPIRHL